MSRTAPGIQNFVAIGLGVSAPQIRDSAVPFDVSSYLRLATAYTDEQIFTQNTSKDVAPGKEVPFRGHNDDI